MFIDLIVSESLCARLAELGMSKTPSIEWRQYEIGKNPILYSELFDPLELYDDSLWPDGIQPCYISTPAYTIADMMALLPHGNALITINEEYECRLPDMYKITAQRAHKAADACAVAVINLIESKQLNVEQTNFIINP